MKRRRRKQLAALLLRRRTCPLLSCAACGTGSGTGSGIIIRDVGARRLQYLAVLRRGTKFRLSIYPACPPHGLAKATA